MNQLDIVVVSIFCFDLASFRKYFQRLGYESCDYKMLEMWAFSTQASL